MIKAIVGFIIGASLSYAYLTLHQPVESLTEVYPTVHRMTVPTKPVQHVKVDTPLTCLQRTVYLEAANQGVEGMTAVANVVMNRLQDDNFPDSVCAVVKQSIVKSGHKVCQFTSQCTYHSIHHNEAWKQAGIIARQAINGSLQSIVQDAKFFHASYMLPTWASQYEQVATIGGQVFYR